MKAPETIRKENAIRAEAERADLRRRKAEAVADADKHLDLSLAMSELRHADRALQTATLALLRLGWRKEAATFKMLGDRVEEERTRIRKA